MIINKRRILSSLALLVLFFISNIPVASAVESTEGLKIDIKAQLSDNQYNKEVSYFDIMLASEQKQSLEVMVKNTSNEDATIKTSINSAKTNSVGVIDYSPKMMDYVQDVSQEITINDLVKLSPDDQEFTISPKETRTLKLSVDMAEKLFDGIVAGAIYFEQQSDKAVEGNIKHLFSAELGIVLRQNENEVAEQLNVLGASVGQQNGRNAFKVVLQNEKPLMMRDMTINVVVKKKGETDTLYSQELTNVKIAPNTQMSLVISTNSEPLIAGEYIIDVEARSEINTFKDSKNVLISREKARKLNQSDPTIKKNSTWLYVTLAGATILLILIIISTYLIVKRSKKRKALLDKQSKRRKTERKKRR